MFRNVKKCLNNVIFIDVISLGLVSPYGQTIHLFTTTYLFSGCHVTQRDDTFFKFGITNDCTERNSIFFAILKLVQQLWVRFKYHLSLKL